MIRTTRQTTLSLLGFSIATALFTGVASADAPQELAPLRYAEDQAPAIVNPLFVSTMSEARLSELLFSGLFTDDQTLQSAPDLVSSYSIADDHLSMRLTLRSDVAWHDDVPFTATDVLFTIAAMRDPQTASTEAGRVAWIATAEATGDYDVTLTFANAELSPEDKLHFKILPAHKFASTTIHRTDPFRNEPVGTGPFYLEAMGADGSIRLARYPNYHRDVSLGGVVMREVADKSYQAKLLVYQSLEALVRVIPRDLATLEADRGVELYPYQTNSWWYIGMNLSDPRIADPSVRQALSLLVDAQELLHPVGTGTVVTGPFVRSSPFYNHQVPAQRHDPDTARTLLELAGYQFESGTWQRDGQPLTLRVAAQENVEAAQDVVIALQAQLGRYGIGVEPQFLGAAAWKSTVWRDHDFDLVLSQWTFDRNEDIREQFHSDGTKNFLGYSNPEVDAALDEARAATDPQAKRALLQRVHALIATDQPMVFLWTLDSYAAVSVRVHDVQIHPFTFFGWARSWHVE